MERVKRQILIVRFFEAMCKRKREIKGMKKKKKFTAALKTNILKDKMNKEKKEN